MRLRRRPRLSGLSPRVRGNQLAKWEQWQKDRSIPACAGEPSPGDRAADRNTVYPRVCGGTADTLVPRSIDAGLSPRVRGNRAGVDNIASHAGSIPACAGEPACSRTR